MDHGIATYSTTNIVPLPAYLDYTLHMARLKELCHCFDWDLDQMTIYLDQEVSMSERVETLVESLGSPLRVQYTVLVQISHTVQP